MPRGPHVDAFEAEFAAAVGARHALALSSDTAPLHLAGVGPVPTGTLSPNLQSSILLFSPPTGPGDLPGLCFMRARSPAFRKSRTSPMGRRPIRHRIV